jgi:hypothetical protein
VLVECYADDKEDAKKNVEKALESDNVYSFAPLWEVHEAYKIADGEDVSSSETTEGRSV